MMLDGALLRSGFGPVVPLQLWLGREVGLDGSSRAGAGNPATICHVGSSHEQPNKTCGGGSCQPNHHFWPEPKTEDLVRSGTRLRFEVLARSQTVHDSPGKVDRRILSLQRPFQTLFDVIHVSHSSTSNSFSLAGVPATGEGDS